MLNKEQNKLVRGVEVPSDIHFKIRIIMIDIFYQNEDSLYTNYTYTNYTGSLKF